MRKKSVKPKIEARATRQRHKGRHVKKGIWEPSARDLEMFHAYNCGGVTYRQIAEAFGLARSVVGRTFQQINTWLFPQFVENIRNEKMMQTESLRHIFAEAMQGWERSKRDGVSVTEKDVEFGEGKIPAVEKSTTTKGQCGNPRFLDAARDALEDIRKLWGMNAPVEIQYTGELRVAGISVEDANRQLVEQIERVKNRLLPSVN